MLRSNIFLVIIFLVIAGVVAIEFMQRKPGDGKILAAQMPDSAWVAPSLFTDQQTTGKEREMIIYGEDLIAHTAKYLGPKGSVAQITNGMNCQNCHLDAGTRAFGNNYGAVFSTYPKFRERSGSVENIYKRVNDCMERSLNGQALDTNSREMQAIYAYMKWLGQEVPRGEKPEGSGIPKLAYLDRAADPEKGRQVYTTQCLTCHGANGGGQLDVDGKTYAFPPLWGEHSYSDGAGLFRLSNFAGFVKSNMPFNQTNHYSPKLTSEEAWDVAAFVNSQPRPHRDQTNDWPDVSKKPVDFPFGPYADSFSVSQHKYGPYKPIEAWKKNRANTAKL